MYYLRFILKMGLLISCMTAGLFSTAQVHSFRFFPVEDLFFTNQAFFGKLGSHFFAVNGKSTDGLNIYIYDTGSHKNICCSYVFPKQLICVLPYEKSLAFMALSRDSTGMSCHFLEVNENGDILRKNEVLLSLLNAPLHRLTTANKTHTLFYQYVNKGNDSAIVHGSIIGADGKEERQLSHSFKFDRERDGEPEIFLDNNGDTHILVFDKYNNYRLSTSLTINSISFAEQDIVSETFTLEKIKLKTMRIFQANHSNCMQALGIYTDGIKKIPQGFYSITFVPGRKNEMKPKFFPLDKEMIGVFKKGFHTSEKLARNNLLLQDIIYSDSESFAIMRLNAELPDPRNPFWSFQGNSIGSKLISRSSKWNAPKLIFIKLVKEQGIEWQSVKTLDVFGPQMIIFNGLLRMATATYNNIFLIDGEKQEIAVVLYEADIAEDANPVLICIKNGKQTIEKIPGKNLVLSPVQFLEPNQYFSLYRKTENGETGIMFIQKKE